MNDLSNKYANAALARKRGELAGKIAALHKDIGKLAKDLAKLDAVLAMFNPGYRVGSIPAIRARAKGNLFKQGELGRLILDALRNAGEPLSSP